MEHLPEDVRDALASDLTIDITTIGRRSGEPRKIEIWFLQVDATIYITGTPGARDWFANLAANPTFTFHLKESVRADLEAVATVVTDTTERRRLFEDRAARWYTQQTPIEDLIEDAPVVRVQFPA